MVQMKVRQWSLEEKTGQYREAPSWRVLFLNMFPLVVDGNGAVVLNTLFSNEQTNGFLFRKSNFAFV